MDRFDNFKGNVHLVIEALADSDACSEHVLNMKSIFVSKFGLAVRVWAKYWSESNSQNCSPIEELNASAEDIIIYHYSGYAEYTMEVVKQAHCLRVLHYHNITPSTFFKPDTQIYSLCENGRIQLQDSLNHFDVFTGDSRYNLCELKSIGAPEGRLFLLPIIFPDLNSESYDDYKISKNESDNILFVGRLCENKCQHELIDIMVELRRKTKRNLCLRLVGGFDPNSDYYKRLRSSIKAAGLEGVVTLLGKVTDEELEEIYKTSAIYISMSEHEGFGVPLVEAISYGMPVFAKETSAVGETLSNSEGLFSTTKSLVDKVASYCNGELDLEPSQKKVIEKYAFSKTALLYEKFLKNLIPQREKLFSLVICTYNRADYLERLLYYIQFQSHKNFEVVVVNGPSKDNTESVAKEWSGKIKYVANSEANLSMSRNLGIRAASGDVIGFIDDDAIPFKGWISSIIDFYNNSHFLIGGVGGPTFYSGTLRFQANDIVCDTFGNGAVSPAPKYKFKEGEFRSLLGTNSSFKRSALFDINGFDEEFDYFLDETDVCLRLTNKKWKIAHSSDLLLRHEFAQSDNRKSKYNYNWFSIIKNTVYFALRSNPSKKEDEILERVKNDILKQRVEPLFSAVQNDNLSKSDCDEMLKSIWLGFETGIIRSKAPRSLLEVGTKTKRQNTTGDFLRFESVSSYHQPQHVLIISKEFPPFTKAGGVGTLYYNLASELLILGHRVTVICQSGSAFEHKAGTFAIYGMSFNKRIDSLDNEILENNTSWSLSVLDKIIEINRREPVSVIDSSLWDSETFAFSAVKDLIKIPLVTRLVTPFKTACELNNWNLSDHVISEIIGCENYVIANSDAVVPISKSILKNLESQLDAQIPNFTEIPAGIAYWPNFDVSAGYGELKNLAGLSELKDTDYFIFLFLGRLERRKGIDLFIEAACSLLDNLNKEGTEAEVCFIVAGDGEFDLNDYLKYLNRTEYIKHFSQYRNVSDSDKELLFSAIDVVVFPSRYESFGIVPLECFVHGKPVIASDTGGIPEVVTNNASGLLFRNEDVSSLVEKMSTLFKDKNLYQALSQGAYARVRELSSINMALASEKLYSKLLEKNN